MGARHHDRSHFVERRVRHFKLTELLEDGIYIQDYGGRVWVNNDNGFYTPQIASGAEEIIVIPLSEAYQRARIVLDGHRQLIVRRHHMGGSLDRIKYVPK